MSLKSIHACSLLFIAWMACFGAGCRSLENNFNHDFEKAIGLVASSSDERRLALKRIASCKDLWVMNSILLDRRADIEISVAKYTIRDAVTLEAVHEIISNLHENMHVEVCYKVVDWLDEARGGAYSTRSRRWLVIVTQARCQTGPIRDAALAYLKNRFSVDYGYDQGAWQGKRM